MGRRRWNKKHPERARMQQEAAQRRETGEGGDPAARLLALHPGGSLAAVAVGARVTVVDCRWVGGIVGVHGVHGAGCDHSGARGGVGCCGHAVLCLVRSWGRGRGGRVGGHCRGLQVGVVVQCRNWKLCV